MASPSLPSYWLRRSRKDLAEQAIVAKREQEVQRLQHWNAVSEHYRKADLQSSVHSALISTAPPSYIPKANIESTKKDLENESKRKTLETRRAELSRLLKDEELKLKIEMEEKKFNMRKKDYWSIEKMKKELEKLQNLRKEHKEMNINEPRGKEISYVNELFEKYKQENTKAEDLESFSQHERLIEELETKLGMLNKHEKQMQLLKDKELAFNKKQQHINELIEKYYQMKNSTKRKEISIAVVKKSKNRLRQKALEIENELKFDHQMLDYIFEQELQIEEIGNEELFSSRNKIKNMLEEQMKFEKERQKEFQLLYDEEAEKVWTTKEKEWNKEREAREIVINNILQELKCEIQNQIKKNAIRQKEMLQKKNFLMKELEYLNCKMKEKHFGIKNQLQKDLETQIENRLSKYEEEKRQLEEEEARIKPAEEQERALLEEEI